jgi:ABC-type multidrug transport system ATPase subunit
MVFTLNGATLSDKVFKKHCFVVKQQDFLWSYITARETLIYAAKLYDGSMNGSWVCHSVNLLLKKLGLDNCADTKCSRLRGGGGSAAAFPLP